MRLLGRLELGGIELLVQVGAAVIGETVEAAVDLLEKQAHSIGWFWIQMEKITQLSS